MERKRMWIYLHQRLSSLLVLHTVFKRCFSPVPSFSVPPQVYPSIRSTVTSLYAPPTCCPWPMWTQTLPSLSRCQSKTLWQTRLWPASRQLCSTPPVKVHKLSQSAGHTILLSKTFKTSPDSQVWTFEEVLLWSSISKIELRKLSFLKIFVYVPMPHNLADINDTIYL